ncbi:atrial natriuretic peptide receptor 1-like [Paramacrobiotus metropolitanus]|uniref:atrial natriuretic peptide receptor 1-like n=1 Tax=Paramacrobiotus metropolitanus TaxID=2943436 RepID=UPI0024462414|nr:atrial natriuretic peptide receptor 1-like [Paramacrobiotus metropolitanus]
MNSSQVAAGNSSLPCADVYVQVYTLTLLYPTMLGSLPYLGPAFDLSLERIKTVYPHHGHLICCNHAFLGCEDAVQTLPIVTGLDLLMITTVAPIMRNKAITPTWISTTSNSFSTSIRVYQNLCSMFKWHTLGFLLDKSYNTGMDVFGFALFKIFSSDGFQPFMESYNSKEGVDRVAVLNRLNAQSRIILFFGESGEFRKILKTAAGLNMTMGEHVYVISTPFRLSTAPGYLSWDKGDSDDPIIRQAYRSVLIVESDLSIYGNTSTSDTFSEEMIRHSHRDYNHTYLSFQPVSPHPGSTYASMMMVAQVYRILEKYTALRVSDSSETWASGAKLAKRLMNRTFHTDVSDLYIDSSGERVPRKCVNQLSWNTSELRTLFVQVVPELELRPTGEPIEWLGPWPPPNEPRCGYRGDKPICRTGTLSVETIAGTVAAIVVICVASLIIIWRTMRTHALNESRWRITPELLIPRTSDKDVRGLFGNGMAYSPTHFQRTGLVSDSTI